MSIKKLAIGISAGAVVLASVALPTFAVKPDVQTLNGGGQIVDGNNKISFGGNIKDDGQNIKGQFQVNFHNTSDGTVSGGKFHSTNITSANWFPPGGGDCDAAMNVKMIGRFNGVDGYILVFRAGDNVDTVRITISGPGVAYDTHSADFTDESACVGSARTGLDRGNIKINL